MKGLIAYYSTTGNTRKICELIQRSIPEIPFDLLAISQGTKIAVSDYDIFGFATFADELRIPELMKDFFINNKTDIKKPTFVLNTHGSISGRTLTDLISFSGNSGFTVINAISVHTPENFPPMIKLGLSFGTQPSKNQEKKLKAFIASLRKNIQSILENREAREIKPNVIASHFPLPRRFMSSKGLGELRFDPVKCTVCKICERDCPSHAITFTEKFSVDASKCQKCWKCYNRCPTNAIYGTHFPGGYQYKNFNLTVRLESFNLKK